VNIFYVDRCPKAAARALCDKHVVKMVLETAQILSTTLQRYAERPDLYRPTHTRHPCVIWTGQRLTNYRWVLRHGAALAREYERRYGRRHKSADIIYRCAHINVFLPRGWTEPPQCMPDIYRRKDTVEAYRAYYRADKARFARWERGTPPPTWWPEEPTT